MAFCSAMMFGLVFGQLQTMFKASPLFLTLVFSSFQLQCQWFYQLPTYDLLKDSCVSEIVVEQFQLRAADGWINDTQRDPSEKATPMNQIAHYYINDFGKVDSLIHYFNGKRFGGFKMRYDAEVNLIETHEFRPERQYMFVNRIEKIEGGYSIKYFSDQKLFKQSTISFDSIIIEEFQIRVEDSLHFRYDPETDESFRNTYINDTLVATGYIRWKAKDGVPDSLIIINEYFDDRVVRHYDLRGSGRYEGRFKALPDGSPVVPKSSVFHRSIEHYNYFNHIDTFHGLHWEPARHFSEKTLPRESLVHFDHQFNNSTTRSFCTIDYIFKNCPEQ